MFFEVSESRNQASTPHYYEKIAQHHLLFLFGVSLYRHPGRHHIFGCRPGDLRACQLSGDERGKGHAVSVQPKELQLGVEMVCLEGIFFVKVFSHWK
jgi:hypothetical protein